MSVTLENPSSYFKNCVKFDVVWEMNIILLDVWLLMSLTYNIYKTFNVPAFD